MHTTINGEPLKYGDWYWYVTPEFKVIRVMIQNTKYEGGLVDSDVEMIYLIDEVGSCDFTNNKPMSFFPDTYLGRRMAIVAAFDRIEKVLEDEENKLKPLKDRREDLFRLANHMQSRKQ